MHLKALADAAFRVVPGHREAMNPESMHTDPRKACSDVTAPWERTVFMGSGFGPAGRPGMTKVILSQALRSGQRPRLEGRTTLM